MTLRGLLLGSAAGLLAVTGVHAADAIMAEPEPVEYVRVCDAYGAGFFYIPGTETCLQISGYVWFQVGATDDDGPGDTPNYNAFAGDGLNVATRVRVNFDARSDTEWGTLQSYIRLQSDFNGYLSEDGGVGVDQGWISLGGFRMGYTESAWYETRNAASSYGAHAYNDLYTAYQQRDLLQYNFGGDTGLFGTISLEDDALDGEGYVPDVVGLLGYGAGWGTVWAKAAYDESAEGWAATAGVQVNIPNMEGSSVRLIGYYADSDNDYGTSSALGTNPEWSVMASYYGQFTPTLAGTVGVQYFDDLYVPGTDVGTGIDAWAAVVGLIWTPVTNFEIRAEVNYDDTDVTDGTTSGYLRFTRFF